MTREMIEHYEKLAEHYNNLAKLERDKQMSCAPSADEEFYKEQYLEAVALIKKVEEILQWSDEIGLHLSYPAWKLATKIGNAIEPYLMARGELEYYGSKDDDEKQTEINLSIADRDRISDNISTMVDQSGYTLDEIAVVLEQMRKESE